MYRKYPALLSAVGLLCALEFLQTGMLTFASAPIRGEIEASPEEYSLVAALYACIAVLVISKQRWLTERLGWRSYMLGSVAIYIVGAVACSVSTDLATFTFGRIVMALGGSAFMTSSRIMVNLIPPGPGRFVGIKVFATGLACGIASGPIIASMAVAYSTWQAIFWVLIAVAAIAGLLCWSCLPSDTTPEDRYSRSSPASILLLALGSFFMLYILQRSYYEFYNETEIVLAFCALAAISLFSFFWAEQKKDTPLLKVKELMVPRYVWGVTLFCFSYLILGANNYVLPSFLQSALGYSWESVGHFQSLGSLGTLVSWLIMARILPKHPAPKKFFVLGFLALLGFGYLLSSITPGANMWLNILPALILNGCFVMLVLATTATQTFRDVGHDEALFAHAQQVKNMLGQIATAMGTALATVFMQWRSTKQYDSLNIRLQPDNPLYVEYLQQLTQFFAKDHEASKASQMAVAQIGQMVSQQASLLAGIEYFWIIAGFALLALAVSVLQRIFR